MHFTADFCCYLKILSNFLSTSIAPSDIFKQLNTLLNNSSSFNLKGCRSQAVIVAFSLKNEFTSCFFPLIVVQYIQNPPGYFVEKLHATHYGGLDDDKTLARVIISRQDVRFSLNFYQHRIFVIFQSLF